MQRLDIVEFQEERHRLITDRLHSESTLDTGGRPPVRKVIACRSGEKRKDLDDIVKIRRVLEIEPSTRAVRSGVTEPNPDDGSAYGQTQNLPGSREMYRLLFLYVYA